MASERHSQVTDYTVALKEDEQTVSHFEFIKEIFSTCTQHGNKLYIVPGKAKWLNILYSIIFQLLPRYRK